jgi:hypothetical protein
MDLTEQSSLITGEEELSHKSHNLNTMCADFVSKGWKLISEESLELVHPYNLSTFKRDLYPKSVPIFLKIFNPEVLDLMLVSSFGTIVEYILGNLK